MGKRRIHPTPKMDETEGFHFQVPGAFKLDHVQPIKLLILRKFSIFFTFILGGQFLLPQRG